MTVQEKLTECFIEGKSSGKTLRDIALAARKQIPEAAAWIDLNCHPAIGTRYIAKRFYSAIHNRFSFQCPHGFSIGLSNSIELKFSKEMKNGSCSCYAEYKNSEYVKQRKMQAIEKQKNTCMSKYGTASPANNEKIREKILENNREKYGCDWPAQNPAIHNKTKATCLERYGAEFPLQTAESRARSKNTCVNQYGVEYPTQSHQIKQKQIAGYLNNYGVEHHTQRINERQNIRERMLGSWKHQDFRKKQIDGLSSSLQKKYNRNFPNQVHLSDAAWEVLNNRDSFAKHLISYGISEFSRKYSIGITTIYNYHKKYKLNIFRTSISSYQVEIENWLEQFDCLVQVRNRKVLGGKELDFYFPQLNKAIEFQGDFWHASKKLFKSNDIHPIKKITANKIWKADKQKRNLCKKLGIELFWVWESDWITQKDFVKQQLINTLGLKKYGMA